MQIWLEGFNKKREAAENWEILRKHWVFRWDASL